MQRKGAPTRSGQAAEGAVAESGVWTSFQLWIGIMGGALALSLICQVIVSASPGPLRDRAAGIQRIWPQEWSFFSRYRDAPTVRPFRVTVGGVPVDLTARAETADEVGGFRREWMSQLIERSYLAQKVPAQAWTACRAQGWGCVNDGLNLAEFHVVNSATHHTLCGELILVRSPSIDRSLQTDIDVPVAPTGHIEVARIEALCEH